MFADSSAAEKSFRRPDENVDEFGREVKRRRRSLTPPPAPIPVVSEAPTPVQERAAEELVEAAEHPSSKPVIISQHELPSAFSATEKVMSRDELNKLNAQVLRAKLMGQPNAEELEKEYERQLGLFEAAEHGVADQEVHIFRNKRYCLCRMLMADA